MAVPAIRSTTDHKVVVVVIGGVRRDETFSPEGLVNIPHLGGPAAQSLFLSACAQ
jgi:hypothetical protein